MTSEPFARSQHDKAKIKKDLEKKWQTAHELNNRRQKLPNILCTFS